MKKLLLAFAILGFVACGEGTDKGAETKTDTANAATTVDTSKATVDTSKAATDTSKAATSAKDTTKAGN